VEHQVILLGIVTYLLHLHSKMGTEESTGEDLEEDGEDEDEDKVDIPTIATTISFSKMEWQQRHQREL
jgi:hypothetical protein